ncbi:MAG TPA: cation diffusion facilitator family transporter [Steroidobacteraceae bacterium]|nr:cation diffusion facilitator family transporter [Steroidobacteraceae bacterium]
MEGHSHGHHHGHNHGPHQGHSHAPGHGHGADQASERRLWVALVLLLCFTVVEAGGGVWANSVALYAEAAHMLADTASLLLAIVAIRMARLPARADRTYGHRRYQTLAAYTNGLVLLALTVAVVVAAVRRLLLPPPVNGTVMLVTAVIGALANVGAFLALSGATSLNERGARLHVLSDLAGSVAAIGASALILWRGWVIADPLLSLAVSVLILRSGWQLTRNSAHVLLEGAPPGFDPDAVEHDLEAAVPGIKGVHHIHAWSLTGETPMLTLHATLQDGADRHAALTAVMQRLHERFGVDHATVQIEEGDCAGAESEEDCHQSAHAHPPARATG